MFVPLLHFGLGSNTSVDSVVVEWPTGKSEKFTNPGVDRRINITENVGTLSVQDVIASQESRIYPNPFSSGFTLQIPPSSGNKLISIVDLMGKIVFQIESSDDVVELNINQSSISTGMYLLKIVGNDGYRETMTIVKNP